MYPRGQLDTRFFVLSNRSYTFYYIDIFVCSSGYRSTTIFSVTNIISTNVTDTASQIQLNILVLLLEGQFVIPVKLSYEIQAFKYDDKQSGFAPISKRPTLNS